MREFRVPVFRGLVAFILFAYIQPPVFFLEDFADGAALHAEDGPDVFLPGVRIVSLVDTYIFAIDIT